jgi:hypothetical protein
MTKRANPDPVSTRVVPPGQLLWELEQTSRGRSAAGAAKRGRKVSRHVGLMGAIGASMLLLMGLVGTALGAVVIDMTTTDAQVTYNGAVFRQGPLPTSAGTGVIDPFVRIGANAEVVQGYNTDFRPLEFDEDSPWTESLLLSALPQVNVGGTIYRKFNLDINQTNNLPLLSLDELQVLRANAPDRTGFNPATSTFSSGASTLVYDLDSSGDAYVKMNYSLEPGSGVSDMIFLVPDSAIGVAGCDYGAAGCATWIYVYSLFGGQDGMENNDGFEEWSTDILPFVQLSKTATGTLDRSYSWTIDKSGSPLTHDLWAGQSADTDYDIDVVKSVADSNLRVTGNVTITVPAKLPDGDKNSPDAVITSLTDVFAQGAVTTNGTFTDCAVPFTVKAGESRVCAYTLTPPSGAAGVNTVTAVVTGNPTSFTATANVASFTPTVTGYDTINVTDTFDGGAPEALGSTSVTTEFDNDQTFSCSSDPALYAGDGKYSYTKTNVARIVETNQTDSETVTVNCYAPVVSKTADGSFDRDWDWTIDKTGDQTSLVLAVGQSFQVNYSVVVTASKTDSGYEVHGTISVSNPAGSPGVMNVDVADQIGTTSAVIDCGGGAGDTTLAVAVGATGQCSYTFDFGTTMPTETVNTATVTFNTIDFTATDSFGFDLDDETDECIAVEDDIHGLLDAELCVSEIGSDLEYTFNYSEFIGPFEVCGPYEVVNTATFETNDNAETDSDDHTVVIDVPCGGCTLTQGYWKTHSASGPAPYDDTWALLDTWYFNGTTWVNGNGAFLEEDELFFSTKTALTWYTVFWTAPAGNAYFNLAHQYQAAVLNVLNEASVPANVATAIAHAESLFETYTPADIAALKGGNPVRKDFIATAGILAKYNEGYPGFGPGHCDEDSLSSRTP